jgi:hypothetical protein
LTPRAGCVATTVAPVPSGRIVLTVFPRPLMYAIRVPSSDQATDS